MLYTNADQFLNERDELLLLITGNEPDLIIVTEVLPKVMKYGIRPACLSLTGYKMYLSFDPLTPELGSGKRGLAIYAAEGLCCRETHFFDQEFNEHMWLEVSPKHQEKLLIGNIYRSPGSTVQNNAALCTLLNASVSQGYDHVLIVGDFNLPNIDWETRMSLDASTHFSHAFLETIHDCFLFQKVMEPTRYRDGNTPHILDLILCTEDQLVRGLTYLPGIGKSDHICLRFSLACNKRKQFNNNPSKLALYRGDFDNLKKLADEIDWLAASHLELEHEYEYLLANIKRLVQECIPFQLPRKRRKKQYLTREALKCIKKKDQSLKRFKAATAADKASCWEDFRRKRNDLRRLTRRLKRAHQMKIAKEAKTNPKLFWSYSHSQTKTREKVEDLRKPDGGMATQDNDKAEVLSSYFSSVFTRESMDHSIPRVMEHAPNHSLLDVDITPAKVEAKIRALKPSSSPGPDGLHPRILRELAPWLSLPLASIFQKSLECGRLPEDWKIAEVVPIYKKGSRNNPSNYRPVSLTSVPSKLMESIVRDSVLEYMQEFDLLCDAQHGFVPRRSCASQLLSCMEDWTKAIEQGQQVDVAYLDFAKAFDSVPHKRMIQKLQNYGVGGNLLRWLEAFISDRRQRVRVNGAFSEWASVTSGVPQGSVLGPTLFVIFVNDLPSDLDSGVRLFADDAKVYSNVSTALGCATLQGDLAKLERWSTDWLLKFNVSKCSILHLGARNPKHSYTMLGQELSGLSLEKDLGVLVDKDLKFRRQAAAAANKANQILGVIKRTFVHLDLHMLPLLYKALVRPHLEYGNEIWGPFNKADQLLVERVQRRATRLLPELRSLDYEERLRKLQLPSLQYRRRRGDMIIVYKLMHGLMGVPKEVFFKEPTVRRTRGHRYKVDHPQDLSKLTPESEGIISAIAPCQTGTSFLPGL